MKESEIEAYLCLRVVALGGECRKVKWIGRSGAPDRLVMLPGKTIWVELKRPGQIARPHQLREHARMRRMGQYVEVIDAIEGVNEMLSC
jgi:hypothetical protein